MRSGCRAPGLQQVLCHCLDSSEDSAIWWPLSKTLLVCWQLLLCIYPECTATDAWPSADVWCNVHGCLLRLCVSVNTVLSLLSGG